MVAILLLTWQSFFDLSQSAEYQVLEYYAGVGRIARLSACTGYRAAAFDVVFDKPEVTEAWPGSPTTKAKVRNSQSGKKCAMDLTTSSGFTFHGALHPKCNSKTWVCFKNWNDTILALDPRVSDLRLALAMALQGQVNECISFWGICCSSWIHMNCGTSGRNHLSPMGCESYPSVQCANMLVSRLGWVLSHQFVTTIGVYCSTLIYQQDW